jgi:FixJ family two-component response regulator
MTTLDDQTVFVVDDDGDVRKALRWLVESVGLKAETYGSAEEFIGACSPETCGCLVLDVRMPGMGGLGLLENMSSLDIHLPVIVLTGNADVSMAVRAMKAGALDLVEKPFADQDLLDKIGAALREAAQRRKDRIRWAAVSARLARLTRREREVMDRLAEGKPSKLIAAELAIGLRTVETHRKRVMQKMQVRSVAQLANMSLLDRKTAKPK